MITSTTSHYKSSTINSATYDVTDQTLTVVFKWATYVYEAVDVETWNKFNLADSQGKALNEHIKGSFEYAKYTDPLETIGKIKFEDSAGTSAFAAGGGIEKDYRYNGILYPQNGSAKLYISSAVTLPVIVFTAAALSAVMMLNIGKSPASNLSGSISPVKSPAEPLKLEVPAPIAVLAASLPAVVAAEVITAASGNCAAAKEPDNSPRSLRKPNLAWACATVLFPT